MLYNLLHNSTKDPRESARASLLATGLARALQLSVINCVGRGRECIFLLSWV